MTLLLFAADRLRPVLKLAALSLAVAILAPAARAQNAAPEPSAPVQQPPEQRPPDQKRAPESEETIAIHYAADAKDMNDLQTALRNMLPRVGIYGVQSQSAIAIRGVAEDLAVAKRMIAELDRPRKTWRVTYTISDMDNGKSVGAQHITLIVVEGTRTTLREGNRFPLVVSTQKGAASDQDTQIQYLDVGLNIDANIDGGRLHTRIEQSGIADEKSGLGAADPVVRQTTLEGVSNLSPGKPVVLGSLDVPGTTRHQEIEVTSEPLT